MPSSTSSEDPSERGETEFRVGMRVIHRRFGGGTIRRFDGGYAWVVFDNHGLKQLDPTASGIQPGDASHSSGRISPSWGEIDEVDTFVPGLTPGERDLARYLDSLLPKEWRVYVRPHLDGDLPSLALLSQDHGAMLWDVVELRAADKVAPAPSEVRRLPVERLERIRRRIYDEYLPDLGEQVALRPQRFGVVRLGLYFPNDDRSEVARYFMGESDHIVTRADLQDAGLAKVVPILSRRGVLTTDESERFQGLFGHYTADKPALETLTLRKDQNRAATPAKGLHLVRGVAGSGKSIALAHRAVRNAMAGRRVLVLTYNRTLTNYMRHLISLVPGRFPQERIVVRNFHDICLELRRSWPHLDGVTDELDVPRYDFGEQDGDDQDEKFFEEELPSQALRALAGGVPDRLRFDSVLIDEGQDFSESYLAVAERLASGAEPEVAVAVDDAQRLYSRNPALRDAGVARRYRSGRALTAGVRSPHAIAEAANAFIDRWHLETPQLVVPPEGLGLDRPLVAWQQSESFEEAAAMAVALVEEWIGTRGLRCDRIALLVPSKSSGTALVQLLAERRIASNHIFAVGMTGAPMDDSGPAPKEDKERIRFVTNKKRAFRVEDQRLKLSTIHSFKGWESHHVICLLDAGKNPDERQVAAVYVAMTRSRGDVVFIGAGDGYGLSSVIPDRLELSTASALTQRFLELLQDAKSAEAASSGRTKPASRTEQEREPDRSALQAG